jgi:hypothetical protein
MTIIAFLLVAKLSYGGYIPLGKFKTLEECHQAETLSEEVNYDSSCYPIFEGTVK